MKIKSFILLVLCLYPLISNAQNIDEINLKNGSIIRGNIVSLIPDGEVTINDQAGNTWVFQMSEVLKIVEAESESENKDFDGKEFASGFCNMTSVGVLAGSKSNYNNSNVAPFSLMTSNGYLFSNGLYTGLAAGIEYLDINYIPLMLDLQYFLSRKDVAPVLFFRGGYTLPTMGYSDEGYVEYNYSGGFSGAIGVGIKIRTRTSLAWDFSLLYRHMRIQRDVKYEYQPYTNYYTDIYNRLEMRIGFYFGK